MPAPRKRAASTSALVPAAARTPEVLTHLEAALNGEAIEMFAKAVGGRDRLADVLAVAATSPDVEKIALYLVDPKYRDVSLRRLCGYVGITVADLFAAYKKALLVRSHIEATHIIAAKLPPIVTDVMDKALSDPTVERHKLALEVGQLIEKKGGIVMQQNTIAAGALAATGTGALEQLHQAVGDLLFSPGRRRAAAPALPVVEATLDDQVVADGGYGEPATDIHPRTEPREPPWPLPTPDPETGEEVPDEDEDDNGDDPEAPRRR